MSVKAGKGFTLIEIIVVMVIIGILALFAVPRFLDLSDQAKVASTRATLGSVRSTLAMKYAENAAAGSPVFPNSLAATDFDSNEFPTNKVTGVTGIGAVLAAPGGTDTSAADGFWYIVSTGVAGAYSDGSVDTSTW